MKEPASILLETLPRRLQFSLRHFMFLILVLSVLLAIGVRAIRRAHMEARRTDCGSKLKQIGLAVLTYHDIWNSFPPATTTDASGKPLHSWRVLILPQYEGQPRYDRYDMSEPWNGPKNIQVYEDEPLFWRCPDDSSSAAGMTNYVAITGPGTAWPGPNQSFRISDFKDGLSSSIMVVEIRNSDIHWMEPRDLDIRTLKFAINSDAKNAISSRHFDGAIVLYGDGAVDFLNEQETEARLRQMVLIADEVVDDPSRPE